MTDQSAEFDIVVVGAGMIGAALTAAVAAQCPALAIALVDAGPQQPVLTIEAEQRFDPRVVALTHASRQFLQANGCWSQVHAERVCHYTDMQVWDAEGTGSIHFDAFAAGQTSLGCIVENRNIVNALNQRLENLSGVVRFYDAKVSALSAVDEGVRTLTFTDGRSLSAPLIVAADGAHSTLRPLCDMDVREWDYGHSAIVTTVTHETPHDYTAWQRFLTTGPLAFLPLTAAASARADGYQSSIVWSAKHELAEALMAMDEAAFNHALSNAFELRLGKVTASDPRFMFPLRQRHLTRYFADSVVFMGDAAHTIHPLAGQGANIGLGDALVLAEEVARAVQRDIPLNHASLLRRYQRRRQGNNMAVMGVMEGFKQLFGADDIALRWLRNAGMSAVDRMPLLKQRIARQAMGL